MICMHCLSTCLQLEHGREVGLVWCDSMVYNHVLVSGEIMSWEHPALLVHEDSVSANGRLGMHVHTVAELPAWVVLQNGWGSGRTPVMVSAVELLAG